MPENLDQGSHTSEIPGTSETPYEHFTFCSHLGLKLIIIVLFEYLSGRQ